MRLDLGCAGWSYDHWKDTFYRNVPRRSWFEHYANRFDIVEVNNTFYRYPRADMLERWDRSAPSGFGFFVKAHRVITHMKRFSNARDQLRDFEDRLDPLRSLRGILFQLPASIERDDELLERIIDQLDRRRRNVIEFRHKSWWDPSVIERLERAGIIMCSVIAPDLPDRIIAVRGQAYVRVHGEHQYYRGSVSDARLRTILDGLEASGCERAYVIFNNDSAGHAPEDALRLRALHEATRARHPSSSSPPRR